MDAIGPVPFAATLLADMGAEVVRIARPLGKAGVWGEAGDGVLQRGRSVVRLDLKSPAGRDALFGLVERADALIEGFRPGVMERLGLGPDLCLTRNPRLVFARMTGWGQSGPLATRAGHDLNYIALTGALHAMGTPDAPPLVPLNLVGDYGGGAMFLVAGLLAALLSARATGRGQAIDAAITDGVAASMGLFYAWLPSGRWLDRPASNLIDGGAPFYRCYRCADGGDVAVGCLEPQFFAAMLAGLGLADRGFRQHDRADWPRIEAALAAAFVSAPRDHWAALFADTDACVTPVLSMAEAARHPHNRARGTFAETEGAIRPGPAPRFSAPVRPAPPPRETDAAAMLERWR